MDLRLSVARLLTIILLTSSVTLLRAQLVPEWRMHTALPAPLAGHATVLLPTGEILIAGGFSGGSATRTSYLYQPATGKFFPTLNQLNEPRGYHALAATTVAGITRVFVVGGYSGNATKVSSITSVEVLEYDAGQSNWRWRIAGSLPFTAGDCRAAWDGGDYVVVTGGIVQVSGALRSGIRTAGSARININTLAIQALPDMSSARAEHIAVQIIGDAGVPQVLVAGGENPAGATATELLAGNVWDPIANPPLTYRTAGIGVGDIAGIGRSFGGFDQTGVPIANCEWYDAKRGWRPAPRLVTPRARFDVTLTAGLKDTTATYLAVAGDGRSGILASCELFHLPDGSFPNGAWSPFPALHVAGAERRVSIAGNNLPLVTGGTSASGESDATELFQPFRANEVDFGSVEVGGLSDSVEVVISNEWVLPVNATNFRIAGSAEFLFRGDTSTFVVASSGSRTLRTYFQPASPGVRTGWLLFNVGALTDTIRLTGKGIASPLSLMNSPIDFGGLLLTSKRVQCAYLLHNSGTDTTLIDSVTLVSSGAYRIISPIGRVFIPPGDSLQVCVEFAPGTQGAIQAIGAVHVAARSFPFQVTGSGTRRYLSASVVTGECDTVQFAPGATTSGFILLKNDGDSTVHVELPALRAALGSLFSLKDSTQFPLDIPPNGTFTVEIVFAPQRESQEGVAVDFPNNGDTSAAASLCFIARSRYLSVSQASVDVGTLCVGDSVSTSLTVENPGGFDSVSLMSIRASTSGSLAVTGFMPRTLGPREYMTIILHYRAQTSGLINDSVVLSSSRGTLVIPVRGTAQSAAQFAVQPGTVVIGDTTLVAVNLQGATPGIGVMGTILQLSYDSRLLNPIRLASLPGGIQLDQAKSSLIRNGNGTATLTLAWNTPMTVTGGAFGIMTEALQGDATQARVAIDGSNIQGLCISGSEVLLQVESSCITGNTFIRSDSVHLLSVNPNPAHDNISVTLISPENSLVTLEFVNAHGEIVGHREIGMGSRVKEFSLSIRDLATGVYAVRARSNNEVIGSTVIMVRK